MGVLIQSEEKSERGGEPIPISDLSISGSSPGSGQMVPSSSAIEHVYRHRLPVRISHWLNVPFLIILIMSGLQIFNAHPALYWGDRSDRDRTLLSIGPVQTMSGEVKGITTILGRQFDTTGVLGYSDGMRQAFPAWATIPSAKWLAMGRQWHLFFAWLFVINGLIFAFYALTSRHITHDLAPTSMDWRSIGRSIRSHLFFKSSAREHSRGYNVLQKIAYITILLIVAPLIVLTGLAMSPAIDAAFPWLLTIFGGRQAARTIHFVACFSFVGFIVIHIIQVIMTGFFTNIRSMVTGWFIIKHEGVSHEA
jgi:thiosulfate reductase cytochrome b subunit